MTQELCVLPVQCKRCSAVFDLWYDLQEQESSQVASTQFSGLLRESLCWRCREAVTQEQIEEEVSSDNDYEMFIEFE